MSRRNDPVESPRMFESDLLDFFSRCHPIAVVVLYFPGTLVALAESSRRGVNPLATSCLFATGFVSWTLAEYWLHRLVFHWQSEAPLGKRLHFLIHGVHHRWPLDKYRLIMPPGASIPMYFAFLGLFLIGFGRFGWAVHAGFVAGYAFYDLRILASPRRPTERLRSSAQAQSPAASLRKIPGTRFAVSNLIWDGIFGTDGSVEPSATVREAETHSKPSEL